MKNERDVVNVGGTMRRRPIAPDEPGRLTVPAASMSMVSSVDAIAGGPTRLLGAVRRKDQHSRLRVLEIEAELVFLVRRVQGRRPCRPSSREETDNRRQAVRQRNADAVAAADAGRCELLRHGEHLIAQCGVGDAKVLFRKNDRGLPGGTLFQQFEQRGRRG